MLKWLGLAAGGWSVYRIMAIGARIMGFMDFLHSMGHLFQNIFSIIKKVVPEQILELAIEKARQAADTFVDNKQRRDWVIAELMHVPGVSESVARLAVELAVQHLKADAIDKGAAKATDAVKA